MVLEKVAEYLCHNAKNKNVTGVADMDIPPELCLELLMAADYLDGGCSVGDAVGREKLMEVQYEHWAQVE